MGREAVLQRAWGAECGAAGTYLAFLLLACFLGLESVHVVDDGAPADAVFLGLLLIGPLPLLVCAVIGVSRAARKTVRYQGLPESARRSLTLRALQDPALFDRWLASQRQANT